MVDATLPTVAFILANAPDGLRTGIWAALAAALLIFLLRLVRRSMQQAVDGLFAVGIAVAIAALSGQARDFFVLGIVRNAVVGAVLLGSIAFSRPLVGVIAEFLAPSHLGAMASPPLPGLSGRMDKARAALHHDHRRPSVPTTAATPIRCPSALARRPATARAYSGSPSSGASRSCSGPSSVAAVPGPTRSSCSGTWRSCWAYRSPRSRPSSRSG